MRSPKNKDEYAMNIDVEYLTSNRLSVPPLIVPDSIKPCPTRVPRKNKNTISLIENYTTQPAESNSPTNSNRKFSISSPPNRPLSHRNNPDSKA